jgi:hypothetical protein
MLGNIGADTAREKSANDSANYRYVMDSQSRNVGLRQKLLNDLLMNDLAPVDVANRFEGNNLNTLGSLAALENQNSIYDDSARRQALLNDLLKN